VPLDSSFKARYRALKPYRTFQEKEALRVLEESSYTDLLKILSPETTAINEMEAMALLFGLVELSVNNHHELFYVCENCQKQDVTSFEIEELFDFNVPDFLEVQGIEIPSGIYESLDEVISTDNIPLKVIKELEKEVLEKTSKIFKPFVKRECKHCNHKNTILLDARQYISEGSLADLYRQYSQLSFYSHNSYLDIEQMYPYERKIIMVAIENIAKENSENLNLPGTA